MADLEIHWSISSSRSRSWYLDLAELLIGYGLVLAVIWTPGNLQRGLYWLAFVFIIATTWRCRQETRPMGLGLRGLRQSLWIIPAAIGLFLLGIWIADKVHSLHSGLTPLAVAEHTGEYFVWALMQQFVLQVYVLLRLLRLGLRRVSAIAIAAAMFAAVHIPNPVLASAVVIWAALCCILYLRYRNLYAIAIAHALLGMCLALTVPNSINHRMRVGLGYLEYPGAARSHLEIIAR